MSNYQDKRKLVVNKEYAADDEATVTHSEDSSCRSNGLKKYFNKYRKKSNPLNMSGRLL